MPSAVMSIFSRKKSDDDSAFEAEIQAAPTPGVVKDFNPVMFDDPAALRKYVLTQLYLESQTAPTSGARIAALKEMAALQLVPEETKYRVQNKGDTIINLVSVSNMLSSARDRTRKEAAALELPVNEPSAEKPQTPF